MSLAARYDVWGKVEQGYHPHRIHQSIRLQGQQLDAETGLHYNRFRYYDPGVGQYVNQDPIGLAGGLHFYDYPANPTLGTDPLGLEEIIWTTGPKRSISDGPRYGNWCGGKWSEGEVGNTPPLDSMDSICKTHDLCYGPNPSKRRNLRAINYDKRLKSFTRKAV